MIDFQFSSIYILAMITRKLLFICVWITCLHLQAGQLNVKLEGGAVWFSKNDVRIPDQGGTRFDMRDLTGDGPDAAFRAYATYAFNERHSLRFTLAPLKVDGTGELPADVVFQDATFTAGVPTKGEYQFNTYRLTYRWMFYQSDLWRWGFGGAVLVRDADIVLEQEDLRRNRDDLGFVPLLHLYGERVLQDNLSLVLDVEGAWSPMGRAVDAALVLQADFESGWFVSAGYRTLEGGADNDDVYTFAWYHTLQAAVGVHF